MRTDRSRDRAWLVPAAAALVLRLGLFAFAAPHPERVMIESDSREYVALARNLARGHGFSQAERPPYDPEVRRTPLYPSTLAAVFATAGEDVRVAAAAGLLASIATVVALVALTTRLAGAAAGPVAGLLLALDLTSGAYATQLLTEPLFALLLLLALLAAGDPRAGDVRSGVSAGLLTGLAALCRPIGLFFAAALLPAFRWRAREPSRAPDPGARIPGPGPRGRTALPVAIAIAVSAATIGVWTLRNARVSGTATFTSQIATNVYLHRAAYVAARLEHRPVEAVRDDWTRAFDSASAGWTEAQRIAWMHEHGRSLVFAHPFVYAAVFADGIVRMLRPDTEILPPLAGLDRAGLLWKGVEALAWAQLLLVYALAAYGASVALRRSRAAALVPLGVLAYFLLVAGPEMYPRFRVPMMPALCMLAAIGATARRGSART